MSPQREIDGRSLVITLRDLRVISDGLATLTKGVDALRAAGGNADEVFTRRSLAARESADPLIRPHVTYAIGECSISVAAALDLAWTLHEMTSGAARGEPSSPYAPMAVARSAIEMLASVAWLLEPSIDGRQRAGRVLTKAGVGMRAQAQLGADLSDQITADRVEAAALGLPEVGRGARRGFGEEMPTISARVAALLGEQAFYVVASSAAHGDAWALIKFGYDMKRSQPAGLEFELLTKSPTAEGLYLPTQATFLGLARAAWLETTYCGWDGGSLCALVRAAYEVAELRPEALPWLRG